MECSRFSVSACQENRDNLEKNIKKCVDKVHEMKKTRVDKVHEMKKTPLSTNDKLLEYIALKEKALKDLVTEKENEIENLKKLVRV
ncbi:MAG: hypothetical protein PHG66_01925 [Candidatus Colwellbacteria bacterium]|nr:hypothetical protein [Candidatus Colwellbacteria bacterium]